ncbi:sulfatase-like hydrolase/transferase [Paracoccus spongiarum]|uniref:Sulfatase-like hydrolase/transferase n=1 Tax=Paracoccus spongiarum TaxID=3064387 RepID=A0ABT9JEE3_9RHOB|nr:sulfatase-like hydrolase/transferase [Paracoccus sp. 2205BS29-5]MDP5308196.1 sulfatase-like hydrolase/transferase [Paracoccus sp. 2205BS29-5]
MRGALVALGAAALALHLVLALPARPGAALPALARLPAELPVLLALLCLTGRAGRIVATLALGGLAMLKLADLAMQSSLGRAFNPVADLPLIDAALRLIAGSLGRPAALGAALAAGLAALAILWLIWRATGAWSARPWRGGQRVVAALAGGAMLAAMAGQQIRADNAAYAAARLALAQRTLAELRDLRQTAARDPFAGRTGLLSAIDRDVLVIFVESYGRTSFDTDPYAASHLPTLRRAEARLAQAGLAMRSGFLTAPTQGGQSWLSHATFANGLWISDQTRHRALLASGRQSLFHHARRAGFRTAAVMPAITRPWPEAARMGFDRVLAAADLGYRGQPFNWVTMPDQFTLAATDRLLREGRDERRLFAQVALISSHAPWTPVPRMLPWEAIGDGRAFDAMAAEGDPPRVVWQDRDRVRRQYRAAIDYALQAALDYAARQGPEAPLILLLGDHQAAPTIALDDRPDVAMHVIGPAALVDRAAAWGFAPGLVPAPGSATLPMDAMRDLILGGFGDDGAPA